jgi:succinate-acetate transporter protein
MPGTYHLMPALNPSSSGNGRARQGNGTVGDRTRIVLRPIGSPLPLGLIALMCAGLLLSLEQLGTFTTATDLRTIAIILLGFAAPLMLIASLFSFMARDTVAGSALGLFAGAWLASGLEFLSATPGQTSKVLGVFFLTLAAGFAVIIAGASFGKAGPAVVVGFGVARFTLAGLYELTGSVGIEHAAAIVGFGLAAAALYSALATEIEDVQGEVKLPMGRRASAREALTGPFDSQLEQLEHEAGVRNQL